MLDSYRQSTGSFGSRFNPTCPSSVFVYDVLLQSAMFRQIAAVKVLGFDVTQFV